MMDADPNTDAATHEDKHDVYESIGNLAHVAIVANTLTFAAMVWLLPRSENDNNDRADNSRSWIDPFDEQWKRDGFCVTNDGLEYWSSHDVCLYIDAASTLGLLLLWLAFRKKPGMEQANIELLYSTVGVFLHGVSHGAAGQAIRDGVEANQITDLEELLEKPTGEVLLYHVPMILLFWACFLKVIAPNLSNAALGTLVVAIPLLKLWVQPQFDFAFFETALLLTCSLDQLSRNRREKTGNFVYASHPILTTLPLTVVGWMESTQCTAFVRDKLYGRVIYDSFIVVSMLVWYMVCFAHVAWHNRGGQGVNATMPEKPAILEKQKRA